MEEAVIISWPKDLNDVEAESIICLSNQNMVIKGFRTEREGLWAANEWIIPTTFVITVTGIFFKSFLEEAGKDAYQMVKSRLIKYIINRRKFKTKLIAASASPKKLSKNYDQSLSISLKSRLHTNLLVHVLISEKVRNGESDLMLQGMFQVLELLYQGCQQERPEESINNKERPNEIYLVANPETKQWDILTQNQMSEKYK